MNSVGYKEIKILKLKLYGMNFDVFPPIAEFEIKHRLWPASRQLLYLASDVT